MTQDQRKDLYRILGSAALLGAGLLVTQPVVKIGLLLAAYLLVGLEVLWGALRNLRTGEVFDESLLMSVATVGALALGDYPEAVTVMLLYQVGELFQDCAVVRSRRSIAELMDIRPQTALVERDGQQLEVPPESVEPGETLIVKPGARVPLDGVVLSGRSSLDTASLTGESLPRDVEEGDEVISGCINQSGLLHVRATKRYADSTVRRVLDLVENASERKARAESFITRFARVYTPIVVGAALLLFALPPLLLGGGWRAWGERALSFLVVSCPCALVISVPLTFFGGIGRASRGGVMVKGGNYLEALANTQTAVFDKTGTLTRGVFTVTVVHPSQMTEKELTRLAAAVESGSDHPISRSITAHCKNPVEPEQIADLEEIAGHGVTALVEGRRVAAGNGKLMARLGVSVPECPHLGTVVHVAVDGQYAGHIVIADTLKDGARDALAALKKLGVRRTVMLTGDAQAVADEVARQAGVDEAYGGLLPADKVARVEALLTQKTGKGTLLFVGDGINDAPVLTRADVGAAMGALGSDAAVEAADVVLMDDDPRKLALGVRIARRTLRIARQNIVFALAVKLAVLALAALGVATMWMAVFADVGVSVLCVLNALRVGSTK